MKVAVVLNHSIDASTEPYRIPRGESEFLTELQRYASRLTVAGPLETSKHYDGPLAAGIVICALSRARNNRRLGLLRKVAAYFCGSFRLAKCVLSHDFTYIFLPGYSGFICGILCLIFRKRYGVYVRGDWHYFNDALQTIHRLIVRHASIALVTGPGLCNCVRELTNTAELVVPMTAFPILTGDLKKDYAIDGAARVLFVGALEVVKGVSDALKAMAILKDAHPALTLILAGSASEERWTQVLREIEELDIGDSVVVPGQVGCADALRKLYEQADVFILPTHGHFEGFPRVIYEAMSFGIPVVAPPLRGGAGFLVADRNFLPARAKDPEDLARAIRTLVADPAKRESIGRSGHESVRQAFSGSEDLTHAKQLAAHLPHVSGGLGRGLS